MTTLLQRHMPEGVTDLSRTISNSEVSSFTQCERKHYYGYLQKLEPRSTGQALSRGIIGHEALAVYYENLLADIPVALAEKAAIDVIMRYLQNSDADKAMLLDLITLLTKYFAYYPANEFEILAVERAYEVPVNDEYIFGMRLDLLARDKQGRIALIDHKFVYDFYGQDVLDMNAQMPKYLGTLRFNGVNAEYAILNQIRYRMKKAGNTNEETFKRSELYPNNNEIRTMMKEQFRISERIMERRNMAPVGQSEEAVRTMNQMTCKNCSFVDLCKSELMGGDITLMKQVNYKANAYVERQNPTLFEDEA